MATRTKIEPEVLDPELLIQGDEMDKPDRLTVVPPSAELMLMPVMDLQVAKARLKEFQEFVNEYMKKDEDYGLIPGIDKPSLFQPGADKLSELYGLAPTFPDERTIRNVDWSLTPALFDYEVTCVLVSKRTGMVVAEGKGSCSSYEAKYRWRDQKKKCPLCQAEAIIKGKEEYGGGWLCWAKREGCGGKFKDGDPAIEAQKTGRIPNEDIADIKNTILKMAQKRAKIAAVLCATRSSGVFTQDVEDMSINGHESHQAARTEGFVISGQLDRLTPLRGELWMKCGERTCVARQDHMNKFQGLSGETVELLVVEKQNSKTKESFFEIKQLQRVVTLEGIPF